MSQSTELMSSKEVAEKEMTLRAKVDTLDFVIITENNDHFFHLSFTLQKPSTSDSHQFFVPPHHGKSIETRCF